MPGVDQPAAHRCAHPSGAEHRDLSHGDPPGPCRSPRPSTGAAVLGRRRPRAGRRGRPSRTPRSRRVEDVEGGGQVVAAHVRDRGAHVHLAQDHRRQAEGGRAHCSDRPAPTVPPRAVRANARSTAPGTPEVSKTTSAPSCTRSRTSSGPADGLTSAVSVAPSARAPPAVRRPRRRPAPDRRASRARRTRRTRSRPPRAARRSHPGARPSGGRRGPRRRAAGRAPPTPGRARIGDLDAGGCRRRDVGRETAVGAQPEGEVAGAQVGAATTTPGALAARDACPARDPAPDQVAHVGRRVDDGADELVAQHGRPEVAAPRVARVQRNHHRAPW